MSGITLTLSLGHIKYLETQEMIYDILVNPSMLSWRRKLFSQLGTKKLVNLNEYEGDDRNPKVVLSEFLNRTSDDFYLAELHGGFQLKQGLIQRKANNLWVFNMKDESLKKIALKYWEKSGVMNWLIEKNEKNYRELLAYKLQRENEFSAFTTTNPEFRSLERQIKELEAWQEAFADWFLDSGYELPKFTFEAAQSTEGEDPQVREEAERTNDVRIQVSDCYSIWTIDNQEYNFTRNQTKVMKALLKQWKSTGQGLSERHLLKEIVNSPNNRLSDTFKNHKAYKNKFIIIKNGQAFLNIPDEAKVNSPTSY